MSLPIELLHLIYGQLSGKDVIHCRGVCRLWKYAVDSLSDRTWKDLFQKDILHAELAVKTSNLSWKEMYKSISLWPDVKSDIVTPAEVPAAYAVQFQVLPTGIMSVLQNDSSDVVNRIRGYGDTIVYYDLDTIKEVHRENLELLCSDYSENDNYIAAVDMDQNLCIIPKATKKKYFVGRLLNHVHLFYCRGLYITCHKEVYYRNIKDMICVAKLVEEKGEMVVKFEELEEFEEDILALSLGNDGLYILTGEGRIYCYKNREFILLARLNENTKGMRHVLDKYGFDWSSSSIVQWMINDLYKDILGSDRWGTSAVYKHANIVIKGTTGRNIQIYNDPYKVNGDLKIRAKLARTISMTKIDPLISPIRVSNPDIQQLFVVEKLNGHRLIVLTAHIVHILNFDCEEKKVVRKRKLACSKSSRKGKKVKPKNSPNTIRRYNTRSSAKK